ncbi:phosphonopyruvate decarboxylase-related protein [Alkalidesulfovibrio alkalitolerans DSM 16529]|uniref:Phosphonopyruvate decarboxylase-related protein n=1 Tax=Alkalidesulfovibrio alkalitolerans DSM 16529 TaxID=1121439 RepID=S7URS6_9BACT|nr:alkaline phosphatase family protein [Alkalidesulfovibrio alkalitolerans]EPR35018.1 phosphonopyruvate decarboxylase-related protein [Alkalidesulfovibrio alkalitolerans DSM 16529]
MPTKCLCILLDGLGDRTHAALDGLTPLQVAATPCLDSLAAAGANGLYHAGRLGQALPSELAHFAMFGYEHAEFPGRGPIEALGAGITPAPDEVAVLAHFCSLTVRNDGLHVRADRPPGVDDDLRRKIFTEAASFEDEGLIVRLVPTKGLFGVLLVSGGADPRFTDTNPMTDGWPVHPLEPLAEAHGDESARRTARVLGRYLRRVFRLLSALPENQEREARGLPPVNGLVTQRPGRLGAIEPFRERTGLSGCIVASGPLYLGLGRCLGMETIADDDGEDPGEDLARRIGLARAALSRHDFVHVHSKAPDEAAHAKSPSRKVAAIESLDRGLATTIGPLLDDKDLLLAVTSDHSTPSSGPLIHSGEPVPLCMVGAGLRRDQVRTFDEAAAARGSLGPVRGTEFMLLVLNALDRARLLGIRDTPHERLYWPAGSAAFRLEEDE